MISRMRIGELLVEQRKLRQSELTRALAEADPDKRLCSYPHQARSGRLRRCRARTRRAKRRAVRAREASRRPRSEPRSADSRRARPQLVRAADRPVEPRRRDRLRARSGARTARRARACDRPEGHDGRSRRRRGSRPPARSVRRVAHRRVRRRFLVAGRGAEPDAHADAVPPPPLPDLAALDPDSVRLSLTDLDDVRVDKDPSQSGQFPSVRRARRRATLNCRITRRARRCRMRSPRPRANHRATRMSIEAMQAGLDHATTREAATDVVLVLRLDALARRRSCLPCATGWRWAIAVSRDRARVDHAAALLAVDGTSAPSIRARSRRSVPSGPRKTARARTVGPDESSRRAGARRWQSRRRARGR